MEKLLQEILSEIKTMKADIKELKVGQQNLEAGQQLMQADISELKTGQRRIEAALNTHKQDICNTIDRLTESLHEEIDDIRNTAELAYKVAIETARR